ncbi:homeodomain-like superfamily protein [Striga asiatica]|uniref:Homeodomain-like superfamily protein n=1 Tax=Striga asiatica TaxID=4170 RepID=A0A5A7QPQ9_STRAF|nr:homeodomain-like superfamily protein [Striga asiatica]
MLRSPSPTGVPPTAAAGPQLGQSASNLSAVENPNHLPPAAEGLLPSFEQPPADSDVLPVPPPSLNPLSKQIPPPPPVPAQTLAAAERSEISRRLLWSITASLAFLALVCFQLARVARHGEINPLKLFKVVTCSSAYVFTLLLLSFTHHIRKVKLGVVVGMVVESLFFTVPIGMALYSRDGQELVMVNLIFLHIMGVVNSAVVCIEFLDLANTGLTVLLNPFLYLAGKHWSGALPLLMAHYIVHSEKWVEFLRHFEEAKLKAPQFPDVVWQVRDILADAWGRCGSRKRRCGDGDGGGYSDEWRR